MTDDFGFNDPIIDVKSSIDDREQKMYDLIIPFLNNLKKDSDTTPIINWPNRAKDIDKFIKKLDKVKGK